MTEDIDAAKADVLAQLQAFKAETEAALATINTTLTVLQEKDAALELRIDNLKKYVDDELKANKDWAQATFATLEQYQGLVTDIAGIRANIEAITASITALEARLTEKMSTDIAAAVQGLNESIAQKVTEITTAYTTVISATKGEIESAYTQAIQTAIAASESSMQAWVNGKLTGYYTIAQMDAKLDVLSRSISDGDATVLATLRSELATARTELTTAYTSAIAEAIASYDGVIRAELAARIAEVNSSLSTLEGRVTILEAAVAGLRIDVDKLLGMIQSLSFLPAYSDGKARINVETSPVTIDLDFLVMPAEAASALATNFATVCSVKSYATIPVRSNRQACSLDILSASSTGGVLSLTVSGADLPEAFFGGEEEAVLSLSVSDGNSALSSPAIPLIPNSVYDGLTLEALEDGTFTVINPLELTIEYSKDGKKWTASSASTISIPVSRGNQVCFRGDNDHYANAIGDIAIASGYKYTRIRPSGKCYASGNVMSLINSVDYASETTLSAPSTFVGLFYHAEKLMMHPTRPFILPATTLSENCYVEMFSYTSIERAPELPALNLARNCYGRMFSHCAELKEAPALPATNLAQQCYRAMFFGCDGLTKTPTLSATTMENGCYTGMFLECTNLKNAGSLPAKTMAPVCYRLMFKGCTSLAKAPELPADELASKCYYQMFEDCTSLQQAPELNVETLKDSCYAYMFNRCSLLSGIKMLATDISAKGCLYSWVDGVAPSGTFRKNENATWDVVGANGVPTGWAVVPVAAQ
ncbi:MAG: hypothetical protein IJV01_04225 [Bacteroidales bacterium]|nr:hypothetical protein [Bacteroidales bacterium]